MMRAYLILLLSLLFCIVSSAQKNVIKRGLIITRSVSFQKKEYAIHAVKSLDSAVIYIEGNNVVVDFKGAMIKGNNLQQRPDEFSGVAIIIRNARNVTIKNLSAKGFKVGLLARNVEGLHIENCDFSYNYRQHLNSTQEREDLSDWMSYHHNKKDEWLRYGAAMYLRGCNNAVISNCKVTGGQNALMMMECNGGLIYNNDFSFNSGIGLGMYQCSRNRVLYNRINFNVRGYSHGIYNRGQDSADILVYEQSNNNLFYKNSVTHGGDGFFLWAGQTTMDSGKGGCNDNLLLENDFSYAPTNGVEVTFSRNQIIHNRIYECDHGIWGGYSYQSRIGENQFRNNRIAIAIEHGQNDTIHHNLFINNPTSVKLWARAQQPTDWGYAKYRDTRSTNYLFVANSFNQSEVVYDLVLTDSIREFGNVYNDCSRIYKKDTTVEIDHEKNDDVLVALSKETAADTVLNVKHMNPFQGNGRLQGRKNIRMTEWGPYNYQYPLIWLSNPKDTTGNLKFEVLGPKGTWKVISAKGVDQLTKMSDTLNTTFEAHQLKREAIDIEIKALYKGKGFVDATGNKVSSKKPYYFTFKKFFQPIDFHVKWYAFDSADNPIRMNNINIAANKQPIKTEDVSKIDYSWWGGLKTNNEQYKQFITIAEGKGLFQKGTYEFNITWDDAVRVYIDGKMIIDEWNPSKYQFDESPHRKVIVPLEGEHQIRLEHVELGGFATLGLVINKM